MPKVDIGDAEIYYEEKGEGAPIMFVPGLGGGGAVWSNQVEALSRITGLSSTIIADAGRAPIR